MNKESIEFQWDPSEIAIYMKAKQKAVEYNDSVKLAKEIKQNLGRDPKILEAGSGNGCVVILFNELGFKNITGIECNKEIVSVLNKEFPKLNFVNGDILNMPNDLKANDFIMSFGLVEHFIKGPTEPLKALYDALNDNGYALISVPCLNWMRRLRKYKDERTRRLIKQSKTDFKYYPWFLQDEFYEYHMTPRQFKKECQKVGFKIIKHLPAQENLGIMHILNPANEPGKLIWYHQLEEYEYSKWGKIIYWFACKIPFLFSHMQYCILFKPPKNEK